ncbi:type VI secretion system lipoprotein TssJ [Dyella acidiphila]|uniref:Type VI secretion system lipoprotein TssJ n=1 Tax=Dyella acidiphila TaxID=2775866 RepID=A0ABR9GAN9_9GAMM|nr:type VI secretion system lipoprotein TssJ [Dyella acidiphila]MBE1161093.1 type VI secretion system lipoprotein TssJ [Dyella acidiphila]
MLPLLLTLAACATSGGSASSTASDAASQAGASQPGAMSKMMQAIGLAKAPPPQPPQPVEALVPLRIYTAKNLNAGNGKKALALVVKVYHLRSPDRFNQTPFDDFLDNSKEQSDLGNDLIDSREMLVLPDQRYITVEHMPGDTRYLGFVAQFRTPAALRWRFVYDVKKSSTSGITLGVHACAMSSTAGALLTELPDDPGSLASVHCPSLSQ